MRFLTANPESDGSVTAICAYIKKILQSCDMRDLKHN